VVARCDGLAPALYHYDSLRHQLERVAGDSACVRRLLDAASDAGRHPDVLIVIAARFGRVSWKYRSIAYATVMKDVGALVQTMYLVATAMGLAPCAVGCGDAAQFARATGLDRFEEGSVGEFVLGRPVPAHA
jgi:SagB-type dehydrogenase family enzyme